MYSDHNNPETRPAGELNDITPLSDDQLNGISGAGNPFDGISGVPLQPIDGGLWQRPEEGIPSCPAAAGQEGP